MVILLAVFVLQIIIDGAYRAPKEVTYWSTLILILMVVGLAHTGYLLPWDQRGYQAAEVFTNIAGASPVVGPQVREVIQGGATKGHQTITRLYSIHVVILPLKIFFLFLLQQYLYRRTLKTNEENNSEKIPFWPNLFLRNTLAMLALMATLTTLTVVFHGADLTAPADAANTFSAARPEWYFQFLFRLLKFEFIEKMGGILFGAIILPTLVLGVLFLMPFIGKSKVGHYFNVAFISILLLGIISLTAFSLYEDANDEAYQHAVEFAENQAERAKELALSPAGIPVEGGLHMLKNDSLTQGPKLYASRCSACHHYNGHDGTGDKSKKPATAADLGNFGSREWTKSVLLNYKTVFKPTKNAKWNNKLIGDRFLNGDMADWSKEHSELLLKKENQKSFHALIEFLYAQSGREPLKSFDEKTLALGKEFYEDGELFSIDPETKEPHELSTTCLDCHAITPNGSKEQKQLGDNGTAPNLTGYASKEWLKDFISNPNAEHHYGYAEDANAMPAFKTQLSEKELDLLVRWMTGDYYKPKK